MIIFTLPDMLNRQVKKALRNGEYSDDEVREIRQEVDIHRRKELKGALIVLIFISCVPLLMAAFMLPDIGGALFMLAVIGVPILAFFALITPIYVNLMYWQFMRAVRKGYPNFSFEYLKADK